jgi:hypothetical protein
LSKLESDLLTATLSASSATQGSAVTVDGDVVTIVTDMTQAALDAVVAAHSLAAAKVIKHRAIDVKTSALIAVGFTFAGKTFSLSQNAQSNLIGLDLTRLDVALVYPITYNTKDDMDTHSLANAVDVHNLYLTALGTYRAHLDSGTALKDQVRAAATVAAVDAVADVR